MRRRDLDPLPRIGVDPPLRRSTARDGKGALTRRIYDEQFKITAEGRGDDGLPHKIINGPIWGGRR